MMSDKLKHFVVTIKLSSNYFLLVFHEIAEEKAESIFRFTVAFSITFAGRNWKKTFVGIPNTYMLQTVTQIFNNACYPLSVLQWRQKVQGSRSVAIKIKQPLQPYCWEILWKYCKHVTFTEYTGTLCFFNDMTTRRARVFGSHSVPGKPGNKELILIFSIWWVLDMPQGRDSYKTTLVQGTRSNRETRLVGKTILVRETDQQRVPGAYRVVIISRRLLSSVYTPVSQKRCVIWVFFHDKSKGIIHQYNSSRWSD